MTAPVYYTARHGLVWSASDSNVRTVLEAEAAAPQLLDMAITERNPDLSAIWMDQLASLVLAIREAKTAEPVEPAAIREVGAAQPQEIAA